MLISDSSHTQDSDCEQSSNSTGKNNILRNGNGNGVSFYGYGNRSYVAPRGSFVLIPESLGGSPKKQSANKRDQYSNLRGSMVDDESPSKHNHSHSPNRMSHVNDVSSFPQNINSKSGSSSSVTDSEGDHKIANNDSSKINN